MFKNIFLLIFVVLFLFIQPIFPGKENGGNKQSSAKTYYYKDSHFQIYLKARKFKKGEVMALILKANPRSQNFSPHLLRIKWSKKWYRLHKLGSQYISFLPISPGIRPEKHILELDYGTGDLSFHKEFKVPVEKQHYKRSSFKNKRKIARLKTPKKFNQGFSKKTLAFIRHCTELKNQAFRSKEKLHLEGDFKYPLKSTFITSSYNAVRAYSSRNVKAHKGVDFRGKKGTPIYAIEAGKVVLSKKMFFEGVFTIIDHGGDVFSLYMHQSRTHVKKGQLIKRGQLIGRVGATGRVTGPHLHLGLRVKGEMVNPLSLIALNF